ncbi:MAG: carbamoyl phosphate synthase small subunit [Oscillospiraceae bacterium]|nr:carbamoyl phosphate synthase small subunit [Oscillospiraceae bacterium]
MKKAWLILESGEKFRGLSMGSEKDAEGELIFTTSSEYCSTLTDGRNAGNLIIFTFPLLGNYGVPEGDLPEGGVSAAGVIAREICTTPSNFRCAEPLEEYLKRNGIPGIRGIDTRHLTQLLREKGTVRAAITHNEEFTFSKETADLAAAASCKAPFTMGSGRKAAVLDLGCGKAAAGALSSLGCAVTVFPCDTPAEEILSGGFEGLVISAGPGDPEYSKGRTENVKKLMGKLPIMALGLGHQLLALAHGGRTEKLTFGHHGGSPVREEHTGRVLITDQNQLWCVAKNSVPGAVETYVNLTDNTTEGLCYPEEKAFSLEFYPDGHFGQEYSYEKFIAMMGGED